MIAMSTYVSVLAAVLQWVAVGALVASLAFLAASLVAMLVVETRTHKKEQ